MDWGEGERMVIKMAESEAAPEFHYDKEHDILYIMAKEGEEEEFVEIAEGVNIELDAKGEIIGIEIFNASRRLPESYMKTHIRMKAEA